MFNEILLIILFNLLIYFNHEKIIKLYNVYDYPDKKRKIHNKKTSLLGGFIYILNFIVFSIIIFFSEKLSLTDLIFFKNLNDYLLFCIVGSCFFLLGFFDDKYDINANLKLLIILSLISFLIFFDPELQIKIINFSFTDKILNISELDYFFTLFCFAAFINAFNLFDGINLQTGIYFLFILIFLFFVKNFNFLIIFLFFPLFLFIVLNYRGKIFLGNSGTYLVSFVISYLFIKCFNLIGNIFSDHILLIMLIPGLDMIRLFMIRLKSKKHPFSPDRKHIHHKFLEIFGYNKTILFVSTLFTAPLLFMIILKSYIVIILSILFYFLIVYYLNKLIKGL